MVDWLNINTGQDNQVTLSCNSDNTGTADRKASFDIVPNHGVGIPTVVNVTQHGFQYTGSTVSFTVNVGSDSDITVSGGTIELLFNDEITLTGSTDSAITQEDDKTIKITIEQGRTSYNVSIFYMVSPSITKLNWDVKSDTTDTKLNIFNGDTEWVSDALPNDSRQIVWINVSNSTVLTFKLCHVTHRYTNFEVTMPDVLNEHAIELTFRFDERIIDVTNKNHPESVKFFPSSPNVIYVSDSKTTDEISHDTKITFDVEFEKTHNKLTSFFCTLNGAIVSSESISEENALIKFDINGITSIIDNLNVASNPGNNGGPNSGEGGLDGGGQGENTGNTVSETAYTISCDVSHSNVNQYVGESFDFTVELYLHGDDGEIPMASPFYNQETGKIELTGNYTPLERAVAMCIIKTTPISRYNIISNVLKGTDAIKAQQAYDIWYDINNVIVETGMTTNP